MTVNEQFKMIGMKVLSTVGGASGPLFATFFLEMGKHITSSNPSLQIIAEAFSKAVDGIKQRGKSDVGQKTMLDVLIPVAAKFKELASANMSTQEIASDINQFAIDCAHNTKYMLPSK
jgi:dihydroxyacetone kinase-like protein